MYADDLFDQHFLALIELGTINIKIAKSVFDYNEEILWCFVTLPPRTSTSSQTKMCVCVWA